MAGIDTKRKVLDPREPRGFNIRPVKGAVGLEVFNEGIHHLLLANPQEATAMGVALIQAAYEAQQQMAAANAARPPLVQG